MLERSTHNFPPKISAKNFHKKLLLHKIEKFQNEQVRLHDINCFMSTNQIYV